ncbi:MAG: polymer-forming cytoskeletal protein [Desulfopila sp.]
MGMFGKKSDSIQEEIERAENETISSIIDHNMTIDGDISFQGKTRIDGVIHGNITGEHLVLSDSGKIQGDITVYSFNCFGAIEGNIRANIITARKSCTIHGKLATGSLTVEPGAIIEGEIRSATPELVEAPVRTEATEAVHLEVVEESPAVMSNS